MVQNAMLKFCKQSQKQVELAPSKHVIPNMIRKTTACQNPNQTILAQK